MEMWQTELVAAIRMSRWEQEMFRAGVLVPAKRKLMQDAMWRAERWRSGEGCLGGSLDGPSGRRRIGRTGKMSAGL